MNYNRIKDVKKKDGLANEAAKPNLFGKIANFFRKRKPEGESSLNQISEAERGRLNQQLIQAAMMNNTEEVINAVESGANPNAKDEKGNTALHYLVESGNQRLVNFLLENGADPNAEDNWRGTPAHVAARFNRVDILKILPKYNGNLNKKDHFGNTPLHIAAWWDCTDAACFLAKLNPKMLVNPNNEGEIPIGLAVEMGNTETVKVLMEVSNGVVDPTTLHKGTSLIDIAKQRGFKEIENLLYQPQFYVCQSEFYVEPIITETISYSVSVNERLSGSYVDIAFDSDQNEDGLTLETRVTLNTINAIKSFAKIMGPDPELSDPLTSEQREEIRSKLTEEEKELLDASLFVALYDGDKEKMEEYMRKGADPEQAAKMAAGILELLNFLKISNPC